MTLENQDANPANEAPVNSEVVNDQPIITDNEAPVDGEVVNDQSEGEDGKQEQPEAKPAQKPLTQEEFNKLYFEKKQSERELEKLKAELNSLKNKKPEAEAVKTLEDFDFDEEAFNEYKIDLKVAKALENKELHTKQAQITQLEQSSKQTIAAKFNEKAHTFAQQYSDYLELGNSEQAPVYSPDLSEVVLTVGPELDYYLLKNPTVAQELSTLSPVQLGMRLASLDINVAPQPAKPVQVSKAPPPVGMGSGGKGSNPASENDSMESYYQKEMERLKNRQ